jgi:Zn-dependent protease
MDIVFDVVTGLVPLILAIAVHEWAHVAMARFLGDKTGEERGRYTLNPLAHIDPIWSVAVPLVFIVTQSIAGSRFNVPFFAAGKPAPYTPSRLTREFNGKRIRLRTAELLVAAAGPFSNVVMALVAMLAVLVMLKTGASLQDSMGVPSLLFRFVVMNIGLALFNMLPVPPLDGSKVLFGLLPYEWANRYARVAQQVSVVVLVLLFMGGARYILGPIQGVITDNLVRLMVWASHA